jgi:hypothetical protein
MRFTKRIPCEGLDLPVDLLTQFCRAPLITFAWGQSIIAIFIGIADADRRAAEIDSEKF